MKTFRTLFFALFFVTNHVTAAVYISTQSGNWNSAATWGGAGFPGPNDDAVISVGHTVTYNIPGAGDKVQNLEIFGVLEMRSSTLRVEQNLTIDGDIIRDLSVAIGEIKLIGTGVVQLNNNSFSHTEMELVFSSPGYIIAGNGICPS